MPAIINFGIFETQEVANSEVNFGLTVAANPAFHGKVSHGYGLNVGDVKFVPSYGILLDMDICDNNRWSPFFTINPVTAV